MKKIRMSRGKDEFGKFIYGYYRRDVENDYIYHMNCTTDVMTEVDPNTVGDFIGGYDIKKRPIFENDILERELPGGKKERCIVQCFQTESGYKYIFSGFSDTYPITLSTCRIVGNIYDI